MAGFFQRNGILVLSVVAALIVGASLWYSNQLVQELASREQRLVQFWARSAEYIYNNTDGEAEFLLENVLLRSDSSIFSIPAILSDSAGTTVLQHTLHIEAELAAPDSLAVLEEEFERMRSHPDFRPVKLNLPGGGYQLVWYRESDEVLQLRYFPYITLLVVLVVLGIIFLNNWLAQRSQLNKVWVGLAKETAHQLGTPISALMGWVELIRLNARTPDDVETADELHNDVHQLEVIADRFSKIGSEPELSLHPVVASLRKSADYYRKRSPAGSTIELNLECREGLLLQLSPVLFEWVIENLLRNALDAEARNISITAQQKDSSLTIDVQDDGKGIPPRHAKRVFRPGFTTKQRGWGLGLSLAKRIVEEYHHGRIMVRHTEPGVGTTFRVVLPVPSRAVGNS